MEFVRSLRDWFVDPDGTVLVDFIGRFEHLQRDRSRQPQVLGFVHVTHSTTAERTDDVEMGELLTDHGINRLL